MDKQYHNSPLSKSDRTVLANGFSGFSDTLRSAWNLIKSDLLRSAIKPALWSFAILSGILAVIFLVTITGGLGIQSLYTQSSDGFAVIVSIFIVLALFIEVLVGLIALIYMSYNLQVRTLLLLNDSSIKSIWDIRDRKTVNNGIYNVFIIGLLTGMMSLVPGMVLFPVSIAISGFGLVVSELAIVSRILVSFLNILPTYLVLSFFGYSVFYCIYDSLGPINSLKASFNATKKHYLANIVRWAPIVAPLLIINTGFEALLYYVQVESTSIAQFLTHSPILTSANTMEPANLGILILIVSAVVMILYVAAIFVYYVLSYYFNYVSFINLRSIVADPDQK